MNPVPQPTQEREILGAKFQMRGKLEAIKKELCIIYIKVLRFQLTCRLHTVVLIDSPIYTDQACAKKLLSPIRINSKLHCFTEIPQ